MTDEVQTEDVVVSRRLPTADRLTGRRCVVVTTKHQNAQTMMMMMMMMGGPSVKTA